MVIYTVFIWNCFFFARKKSSTSSLTKFISDTDKYCENYDNQMMLYLV